MKIYLKEISDLVVKSKNKKFYFKGGGVLNDIDKSDFEALCKDNATFKLWVEKGSIVTSETNSNKIDEVIDEKAKSQEKRNKQLKQVQGVEISDE